MDDDKDNYKESDFEIFNIYPAFIKIESIYSSKFIGIYSLYSSEDEKLRYIKMNEDIELDLSSLQLYESRNNIVIKNILKRLNFNVYTEEYVEKDPALQKKETDLLNSFLEDSWKNAKKEDEIYKESVNSDVGDEQTPMAPPSEAGTDFERYPIRDADFTPVKSRLDRSPPRTKFGSDPIDAIFRLFDDDKVSKVEFVKYQTELEDNKSQYREIDIINLNTFNKNIGVGGVAMLFRYFQFLDAVHDLCEIGRCPWGHVVNRHHVYFKLGEIYANDIKWMLTNNYGGKFKLYPKIKIKNELIWFLKFICLKPTNDTIEGIKFFNYKFLKKDTFPPTVSDPDGKPYIPNTDTMNKKTTYLLKRYLEIEKISPTGNRACSDSLYLGLSSVLDMYSALPRYYTPGSTKIVYHMDAESNKTKICGVMQRICDAVSDKPYLSTNTVEYSPNAITAEYDAAWAQASNSYISRLEKIQGEKTVITEIASPNTLTLKLKCHDVSLMDITYERQNKNLMEHLYSLLIKCITDKDYTSILEETIRFKYLKKFIPIFHKTATNANIAFVTYVPQTLKDPENMLGAIKYIKKIRQLYSNKQVNQQDLEKIYDDSIIEVRTIEPKSGVAKVITLSINRIYSYDKDKFYEIPGAINPITKVQLQGNQNLSLTSSLNDITKGRHYTTPVKIIGDTKVEKLVNKKICLNGWFKSLGDLGQILEFYTKTKHQKPSMGYMPIFLTFDRLCGNLSVFFNPLTILEDSKEKTGLIFYTKRKTNYNNFGKVNKRYIKQKNISQRLKLMSDLELKNKLKSVGIKITKIVRGKRKYLTGKELENKAILFNKLQNTAKKMKIKLMYKSINGNGNVMYKYKTYKRLQNEIKKMKMKTLPKTLSKRSSFG